MKSTNKSGSLSRANKLVLKEVNNISVFSLQHWSGPSEVSSNFKRNPRRRSNDLRTARRAKLVGYKIQETVLNFLIRWLIDHQASVSNQTPRQRVLFEGRASPPDRLESDLDLWMRHTRLARKKTRSSLLLTDAKNLPDRRLKTVLKFVFWRWLTWTNVFELFLIILLIGCCIYQCCELLEEYYHYPTHVSMRKILNDNFLQDLPALTICDNNRVSKETLARNYPQFNDTHFIAISQGTFYSVDNFSVDMSREVHFGYLPEKDEPSSRRGMEMNELEKFIDWRIVGPYLSNGTIAGAFNYLPAHDIADLVVCANIWGEHIPCKKLEQLETIQNGASCRTLFHRSVMSNSSDPAVRELQLALESQPKLITFGKYGSVTSGALLLDEDSEANQEIDQTRTSTSDSQTAGELMHNKLKHVSPSNSTDRDESSIRVELAHMEVIRVRIDFRRHDYKAKRLLIGGLLSIHSNTAIGSMNHIIYAVRPGFWYNFYIQRFDYYRLPPPYSTRCFDYHEKFQGLSSLTASEKKELNSDLLERQAKNPSKLLERYAQLLRRRSLGGVSWCFDLWIPDLSLLPSNSAGRLTSWTVVENTTADEPINDDDAVVHRMSAQGNRVLFCRRRCEQQLFRRPTSILFEWCPTGTWQLDWT